MRLWFLGSQLGSQVVKLVFLQRADALNFKAVLHAVSKAKVTRSPA